jgi:hypothetical protein
MPKVRPAWLILIVVIITVAAVPVLRQHARLQSAFLPVLPTLQSGDPMERIMALVLSGELDPLSRWAQPYFEGSRDFAEQHYPDDPEMLLGAAPVADDEHQLPLLERAVKAGGGPAAWAAYCDALCAAGPSYERPGGYPADPTDPEDVAQAEREIAERGAPNRLLPDAVAPILNALHSWQSSDPGNGLPHALEAWYLYGLHRDHDALISWEKASQLPVIRARSTGREQAAARLLVRMGMPEPEAAMFSLGVVFPSSFAKLRSCARIATYEGSLAVIEGRPDDAIRWWHASFALGQHMADPAETIIGFLVASAIQGIAVSPVWPWRPDGTTGIPNGPLGNGRLFYGDYHDLHVSQVGEEADAQLRDEFIRTKVRTSLIRQFVVQGHVGSDYTLANRSLGVGQLVAALALFALLLFAAVSTWARRRADQATQIHSLWVFIISALIFLPIAEFGRYDPDLAADMLLPSLALPPESFFVPLVLCALAALFAPLLAAIFSRAPTAGLLSVWRGNLRRILPTTVALAALLYLGLSLSAIKSRADYARHWMRPGASEMDYLRQTLGDEWTNPTIPPDSYRAEYPPEPTPQSP